MAKLDYRGQKSRHKESFHNEFLVPMNDGQSKVHANKLSYPVT